MIIMENKQRPTFSPSSIIDIKLTWVLKDVVEKMRQGWQMRWQVGSVFDPILNKKGQIEEYVVPVKHFYDLLDSKLIQRKKSKSIFQYYQLTNLGKAIKI